MPEPTLYILMRTDMVSMNPGKAMAQAAHAANAFVYSTSNDDSFVDLGAWMGSTEQGFGTTITLAVSSEEALNEAVAEARLHGYPAEMIHDPTYPIRDGAVTHYVPVDTCGYVFTPCRESDPVPSLAGLGLHP